MVCVKKPLYALVRMWRQATYWVGMGGQEKESANASIFLEVCGFGEIPRLAKYDAPTKLEKKMENNGVILRFQAWPVYPWMRSSSKRYSFSIFLWGEWSRLPSTARVERAHPDRARSASKEGTWPLPLTPFRTSFQKTPSFFPCAVRYRSVNALLLPTNRLSCSRRGGLGR